MVVALTCNVWNKLIIILVSLNYHSCEAILTDLWCLVPCQKRRLLRFSDTLSYCVSLLTLIVRGVVMRGEVIARTLRGLLRGTARRGRLL